MKKIAYCIVLLISNFASAQYFLEDGYYQIQNLKTDNLNKFYYLDYELNPEENTKTLAEIEAFSKANKNPSIEYLITQEDSQTTKVVVKANHKIFSESYFQKGVLHGKKIIYHGNGNPFHEIDYANGKANGIYKMYSDRGNDLVLETNYKNNVKEGKRIFYNKDRDKTIVEGNYKKGILIGDLIIKEKRSYYFFPNDLKNGKVKRFVDNFLIEEYDITAGYLNGLAFVYMLGSNKIISKTPYTLGKKNGIAEYFSRDGELMTKNEFKFDRKIGKYEKFSLDFKLEETQFYDENGRPTGTWAKYYNSGKLNSKTIYHSDGTFEIISFDDAEQIRTISNYNKNKKQQGSTKQFENGILKNEFFYVDGKTKWAKSFYANGALFSLETNKSGYFERKFYDVSGQVVHVNKVNEHGKRVGIHKNATLKNNELYVYDETHFDENGKKVKWIYKTSNGTIEYNYRNEQQHGKRIEYDINGNIIKESYSYESNGKSTTVSKEEFEKLTKSEK